MPQFQEIIDQIQGMYGPKDFIPLHEPHFTGREREYVMQAIDSTFVSSVGEYVNTFEKQMAAAARTQYAVALVNGTAALHMALLLAGVERNDLVISQALTFIATCNAISYIGAEPVFVDVDQDTMGMSPSALLQWLDQHAVVKEDAGGVKRAYHVSSGRKLAAVVPMHTFGMPCRIDEIAAICQLYCIPLIEDAAESVGSRYKNQPTGSFGLMGTFSLNGNKTITCGGGGAIVTNDEALAKLGKHLTTQAKVPHVWEFAHDAIGYNYRMPNLNAAMACAQLEQLESFVINKRKTAAEYAAFFDALPNIQFVKELEGAYANYWLNAILFTDKTERDAFLKRSNAMGVMTRPVWDLMNTLPMFRHCMTDHLSNSYELAERLVNIPSSVR